MRVSVHMHMNVYVCVGRFERESITQCSGLDREVNYIFWLAES